MTIALYLETGEILHAQEGKSATSLTCFLLKLKQCRASLKAVSMDMSDAYASAVRMVFGDAVDIVHDHYHVVALADKAIENTRKDMIRKLESEQDQVAIKGLRFVLLRGGEKLSENGVEKTMRLKSINEPLYELYLMKEELRLLWELDDSEQTIEGLKDWILRARESENKHFKTLAGTIESRMQGILNYFKHRISNGPIEGINNKIKVLKRQAYGFRDMEYFKLRLYFLHEASVSLIG